MGRVPPRKFWVKLQAQQKLSPSFGLFCDWISCVVIRCGGGGWICRNIIFFKQGEWREMEKEESEGNWGRDTNKKDQEKERN